MGKVVMTLELIPIFKSPPNNDIPEGTTEQLSKECLKAITPLTRLEMIGKGLLWVSRTVQSHLSS